MPITRHAEARALLADPRHLPPPVPQDAPAATLAWLRAQVSRFSSGPVHAARRELVTASLAAISPEALRVAAAARTRELLETTGTPAVARIAAELVPTTVLGQALGVDDLPALLAAVEVASAGYLSGQEIPGADAAVARLITLVGPGATDSGTEVTVARISLLLQAHASTAGLIRNALAQADTAGKGCPVEDLLEETLRFDPPLRVTRRVTADAPDLVVELDLVAANRDPDAFPHPDRFDPSRGRSPHLSPHLTPHLTQHLTFGHGIRPCPGSAHALALAAGVVETLRSAL